MTTVLVVYASRMGSTREIAEAIGQLMRDRGLPTTVTAAADAPDARGFDAVILGSALYLGRWQKDAANYLWRQSDDLANRPTWLFQSGPTGPARENLRSHTPRGVRRLCQQIGHSRAQGWLAGWVSNGDLAGDFRDWELILEWAELIAQELVGDHAPAGS
jgi:menaquinone-dependent protoporphyrinogen oxidase